MKNSFQSMTDGGPKETNCTIGKKNDSYVIYGSM